MHFDEARRIAKENKEKFLNADDRLHYGVMIAVSSKIKKISKKEERRKKKEKRKKIGKKERK